MKILKILIHSKIKSFWFLVLMVFVFSSTSISQEKFKFGIKGGIGFWRLDIFTEYSNKVSQLFIHIRQVSL